MDKIFKLHNQIKHYEWGSTQLIPQFLGIKNPENVPYAEMWMGTHKSAPSQAEFPITGAFGVGKVPLKEISGDLPFLFKLLAVEKPLSIQAHPDKIKASEGYRLEEEVKLDIKSPMRNYKDPNHKPELLCALTRFSFLAGFRSIEAIDISLKEFLVTLPQLKEIITPLQRSLNTGSLAVFLRILFELSNLEKEYICEIITKNEKTGKGSAIIPEQWKLLKYFASQYPNDPAILSPIYLNYITLQPEQAVFIPPGVLHSYISGFGVELMTASDNVLRGGLTPKYIDIPELMNIIDFNPHIPKVFSPAFSSWFCYGSEFFSLSIMKGSGINEEIAFPGKGPAICLVTEGELFLENTGFKKGESFFIPKYHEKLLFKGNFSAFFASPAYAAVK